MKLAGLAEVEAAKTDGRWDAAYASPRNMETPIDLLNMLQKSPAAESAFDQLDARNRYAILYRIHEAKKPETRIRRIEKFVAMLERGEESTNPGTGRRALLKGERRALFEPRLAQHPIQRLALGRALAAPGPQLRAPGGRCLLLHKTDLASVF